MKLNHLYHLYSRIGFGVRIEDTQKLMDKSPQELLDVQLKTAAFKNYLNVIQLHDLPNLKEVRQLKAEERNAYRKKAKEYIKSLNTSWIKQMIQTEDVLLERTTLFWHGHFACTTDIPYFAQQLNNIQRKYALGSFKDLLLEVSKSPAMLQFLNNKQNKKLHPNENFARELMELFTIGKGNYTEQDVKESARAFTGWSFNNTTFEYVFNSKVHDYGLKTFMGRTGAFTGEDIIDILLEKKETARFLCAKIYRFFINEKINNQRLDELAVFYQTNNYHTGKLLKKIMTSDWFYDEENIGANIKAPIDFIVGFSRTFNIIPSDLLLLKLQRSMNQILFYPPNVAGWPGGKDWIDSTTLMFRLKIPSTILNNGKITFIEKDDMPEDNFNLPDTVEVSTNASFSLLHYSKEEIVNALLRVSLQENRKQTLINGTSEPRQLVLELVSMPEYQLY